MRASLIVIAVAFLFLGILFTVIGGRSLLEAWQYRQAIRGDAVATSAALRPATDTSSTEYEVSYRVVVDEQTREKTEVVPVHVWERAERDEAVPVEYLPGRPDTVRVAVDNPRADRQTWIFTGVGVVLLVGGLAAARAAVRWRPPADRAPAASQIAAPAYEASYWPRARQSSEFWVGAIMLLVATPLLAAALLQALEEWRFATRGISTDGIVLTKEIIPSRRNRPPGYEATYRVMVPEGAFENRITLPFDVWSRLQERQSVDVVYLPERPSLSRINGSREWRAAAFLGVLGLVFFSVGATFCRRSVRRARLEWRLRQTGAAATGVIAAIVDRNLKINNVRQFRLKYEYDDFQGRRHTGTHDLPEDEALVWNLGDKGAVRYDTRRPEEAIWLGRHA